MTDPIDGLQHVLLGGIRGRFVLSRLDRDGSRRPGVLVSRVTR